jgi:hypothetical protein
VKKRLVAAAGFAVVPLVLTLGGGGGASPALARGGLLDGPSQVVGVRAYLADPSSAPQALRSRFERDRRALLAARDRVATSTGTSTGTTYDAGYGSRRITLFDRDTTGLPQNEESVSSCTRRPRVLIGGTNDYRGILDPTGNFTGWYFSNDGGRHVVNEGLLPAVTTDDGTEVPSGGDPVFVAGPRCGMYAGSLNYTGDGTVSGVGVYRSTPRTLATCPQGRDPDQLSNAACWPTRRLVDVAAPGHFIDKEWMDVGYSGSAGMVVWVAYGDLSQFNAEGNEEAGEIKAVRCSADLSDCTAPIVLSEGQTVAEYPDVTIGPDGRTYVTWGEFFGGSFTGPTQRAWVAVAEPGSTTFTRHPVLTEHQVVRARETLHAAGFRVGTMFKNTVAMVRGEPRISMIWERCLLHAVDLVCEEPQVRLVQSSDLGATWGRQRVISAGGDNYFPTIDTDPAGDRVYAAWYTHRFDPVFHNRQDVELVRLGAYGRVRDRQRVTPVSNETEADPLLGSIFIGDYIELSANRGRVWVHFNANRRAVRFLYDGLPIPQQDNVLARVRG